MANSRIPAARWARVTLRLRCEPEGPAKSHAAFILRAVLLQGLAGGVALHRREPGQGWHGPWTWHPVSGTLPAMLEPGSVLELHIIVPAEAGPLAAQRLNEAMQAGTTRHFRILAVSGPETRTLPRAEDAPVLPVDSRGRVVLELDVRSPWEFEASDRAATWRMDVAVLREHVARALENMCSRASGGLPPPEVWETVRISCHWWRLWRGSHASRGRPGMEQRAQGWHGPLYLDLPAPLLPVLWPWLVAAGELHVGTARPLGQGHFVPCVPGPLLDSLLGDAAALAELWETLAPSVDSLSGAAPLCLPGEEGTALAALAAAMEEGTWEPSPAVECRLPPRPAPARNGGPAAVTEDPEAHDDADILPPGETGGWLPPLPPESGAQAPATGRLIAILAAADRLVHQRLFHLLRPLDRWLSHACAGFRPGRGTAAALAAASRAWQQGNVWAAQTDIASFFDEIPHAPLLAVLDSLLPPADARLRTLVSRSVAGPVRRAGGVVQRSAGVLQGSPLSPLLANLYLHDLDAALIAAGYNALRYGDDILIMAPTEEGAREALALCARLAAGKGLRLHPDKTSVTDARLTAVRYLGQTLGGADGQPEAPGSDAERALQRPLYLTAPHQWAGCGEGTSLEVREGHSLKARVPLARLSEITLSGLGGISTRLIETCLERRIPVTLCGSAGRHLATLFPEPRSAFDTIAAHHARHAALSAAEMLDLAASLIQAKIDGYRAWLADLPRAETGPLLRKLQACHEHLATAADPDSIRGHEGSAARLLFPWICRRAIDPFFHSTARLPRERRDPWNVLLDCAYHLLFCRIHALLRARSLNPYLGILHSARSLYPSLVCDLQEPFRARCDRVILRLVNQRVIQPADFVRRPDGRWRLRHIASPRLIEAFEAELDHRAAQDSVSLRRAITAQCDAVRHWALQRMDLTFHTPRLPSSFRKLYRQDNDA